MATDTPHPARWERRKESRPQELAAAALDLLGASTLPETAFGKFPDAEKRALLGLPKLREE